MAAEFCAPPGHTSQAAALIVRTLVPSFQVQLSAPDSDLKGPKLQAGGSITTGTLAILKQMTAGSPLYPEAEAAALDAWLGHVLPLEEAQQAWLEPFASQTGATEETRAAAQVTITGVLAALEAALATSGPAPQHLVAGRLTVADIGLAATLHPLFAGVLGSKARGAYPATTAWLQAVCGAPDVITALGALSLCASEDGWVAPAAKEAPSSKKKKKGGANKGGAASGGGAEAMESQASGAAEADGAAPGEEKEMDPEKAARKAAKIAEKAAKKAKAEAKEDAKKAEAAQPKAAGGPANDKKSAAKAEAEAKKKAEAEEVERLLAEVSATPKGHKKDLGKATAAKGYNPRIVEAAWYDWWEAKGFFKADAASKKPPFVIVIPPPNVTGALHIGHALTNSIQDTVVRWRRMSGYNTLWVPGTDHAGIATQTVVEKKLMRERGVTRHDLGREGFLKEVWQWVGEYGGHICHQLRRLGSSVDWSRLVFTMDENLSAAVNEAFVKMYEDGVIYRDNRLVNWCCRLKTAVSDIEVDYIDIPKRTLITVPGYTEPVEFGVITSFAYPLEDGSGEIVVATTRPETMLGDTAVAIHPEDPRYTHMQGKFVLHPVNGRRIPIVCDAELVDMAFGTGAVKVTPAHDPNDFKTGKRHNLESINILDDDGLINEHGSQFLGQPRFKARVTVVQFLKDKGLYRGTADNEMRLGLCSRSKDVIEPILKPQWWVKCDNMAARSCEVVRSGELEIIPKEFEATWFRWLENIRDWCISRQLWWGHRIPAYYVNFTDAEAEDGSAPGMPSEDMKRWVVGRTAADAQAAAEARYPGRAIKLSQDEDVLDTWFSSGLFPFSVFKWPTPSADLDAFYPGALLETGHDILFFWVARMVMQGLQLTGKVPFKQVFLHAMVRDAHGRKMSKSLGNVIDPLNVIQGISLQGLHDTLVGGNLDAKEVEKAKSGQAEDFPDGIEECGTDALRFALCAYTSQARDINLDIKRVVAYRHWCNKMYNAIRFAALNLPDDYSPPANPTTDLVPSALPHAARWLLSRLSGACAAVVKAMEAYDFATATQRVYAFWQYDLCDVFIELMKPVMGLDDADPAQAAIKRATRDTLWTALDSGLKLLHPFMPFVTEELWQRLPKNPQAKTPESIMLAEYPGGVAAWDDAALEADYDYLQNIITKVRKLRSDYGLQKKAQLFLTTTSAARAEVLQRSLLEIATLTNSSEAALVGPLSADPSSAPPKGCGVSIVDDATVAHLLLVGVLDPALELAKLQKKLDEVNTRLEAMNRKMEMTSYKERTPENVQAEDQDKRSKTEAEKAAALAAIADMQELLGA